MNNSHEVVVISGSMKFFDDFMKCATELSMQGYIVLLPFRDPRGSENIPEDMKKMYDDIHRQRIEMADIMYVINKGGYIGKSTLSEITYANMIGREVRYMEDINKIDSTNETKDRFNDFKVNIGIAKDLGFKSVITICGSMKYYGIMQKEQARLSSLGNLVYLPPKDAGDKCNEIMCSRIAASDSIYVINQAGYIGEQTRSNIEFAMLKNKKIEYYDKLGINLRGKIITLCGSRRFLDTFNSVYRSLTLSGSTILLPSIFDFTEEEVEKFTEEEHRRLDENHRRKIDIADVVFIVNPPDGNGHVGENTREEIVYARSKGKIIVTMCDHDQNGEEI